MCKWFGLALDVAYDEETRGVPMNNRTQKVTLLIGGGGTGKTTIILKLCMEVFAEYFPPLAREDRYFITTFSHAQGAAISNEKFKAQTAHTATCYRVDSLRNKDMALNKKEIRNGEKMEAQYLTCRR